MNATCPNCGKVLKVKDEWAGKMLKCPGCTKTFKIGGGAGTAAGGVSRKIGPTPATATQSSGGAPPQRVKPVEPRSGGVAVNWGMISMIALLSLIPIGIGIFLLGPKRAMSHWNANSAKADENVRTIIEHALRVEASNVGTWNPRKGQGPTVNDLNFHPDFMVMSMPTQVHFVGTTSNGKFEGDYVYETTELTGTLTIGGITLGGIHFDEEGVTMPGGQTEKRPAGMPYKGGDNQAHTLAGRMLNGAPQVELDGKRLDIYWPPERLDEAGRVIRDD